MRSSAHVVDAQHHQNARGLPQRWPYRYVATLTAHPGGIVKIVWLLLALLFTALTIGGLLSAAKGGDAPSVIGDLVISALLGLAAAAFWKRAAADRPRPDDTGRPWQR